MLNTFSPCINCSSYAAEFDPPCRLGWQNVAPATTVFALGRYDSIT
jgi:hypothetical protein